MFFFVFLVADPTIMTIPNDKGTDNKTLAYSQYPHTSEFDCPFYHSAANGGCSNSSNGHLVPPAGDLKGWMGYSVHRCSTRGRSTR